MHFMFLAAMAHIPESTAMSYDTEINMLHSRLAELAMRVRDFNGEDVIENKRWSITDKTEYFANQWYTIWKEFVKGKEKNILEILRKTPFIDRGGKTNFMQAIPTFTEIDSFSKFETEDVAIMQDTNELGSSGANTSHMRQGLSKSRFLSDVPKYVAKSNNPLLMTVHIGQEIQMDPRSPPPKKLQYLKNGDKIKGATDDFAYLTTNCWQCLNASPLINDTTKAPEYPRDSEDALKGDTDLQLLTIVNLRCKYGPSGLIMQIIVSQLEGVQPSLTEFHYIKSNERFGITGTLQNYALDLLPDVKLSRTAVRGKIDSNPLLRRAILITSEMCQMKWLWHDRVDDLMCTPKELYDDLKALGYDWEKDILCTRSWWTFDNDKHSINFLSTMDLLRMRKGLYTPYWLNDEQKARIKTKV
jgi:hypothetical protein